jgi:hypothetical protein
MNTPEPAPHAVNAYSSSSSRHRLLLVAVAIFVILILRNAFIRDYTHETRDYLTSVGKTDLIDTIIPKTQQELRLEKINKDELVKQLAQNMTIMMQSMNEMKLEIDKLKSNNSSKA